MRQPVSLFILFCLFGSLIPVTSSQGHKASGVAMMTKANNSNPAECIAFRSTRIIPNIQTMQYLLEAKYINMCSQCLNVALAMIINGQYFPQYGIHTFQPNVLYTDNFPFTGSYSTQRVDLVVSSANPCSAPTKPNTSSRGVV